MNTTPFLHTLAAPYLGRKGAFFCADQLAPESSDTYTSFRRRPLEERPAATTSVLVETSTAAVWWLRLTKGAAPGVVSSCQVRPRSDVLQTSPSVDAACASPLMSRIAWLTSTACAPCRTPNGAFSVSSVHVAPTSAEDQMSRMALEGEDALAEEMPPRRRRVPEEDTTV